MSRFIIKPTILMALLLSISSKDYTIGDFKKNYFKIITATKGFYEVKAGFENVNNEIVVGTGFVNRDLYTDIITVTKDRKVGHFYLYDEDANTFKLNMTTPPLPEDETILSIKLTQINIQHVHPDVLVITQLKDQNLITTSFRYYSINIASGEGFKYTLKEINFKSSVKNISPEPQEPFNIQIFENNRLVDYWLLMQDKERLLYFYDRENDTFTAKKFNDIIDQECENCVDLSNINDKIIPAAYTSAYMDINRDCRADIILESVDENNNRFLEFYYYMNSKFGLIKVVPIPKSYSLGTVEDINENSNPDLLFIDKETGKLVIHLNNYSLKNQKSDFYCSQSGSTEFMYPSLLDPTQTSYLLTQELVADAKLIDNKELGIHGFIKLGDLDLDSYKDLILNMTVNGKNEVYVFLNRPCKSSQIEDNGVDSELCRYFDIKAISDEDINIMKKRNAMSSFYFDLGERG